MNNKKQNVLIIVGLIVLVGMIGGFAFAFFNYTRTGNANTIRVGRVTFDFTQDQTINLSNMFPIDPTVTGIMDDETKVGTLEINITGDTDYADGLEYLVTTTNAHMYTSDGKMVPISLDITMDGLGEENSNYFTARESKNANIYKIMSVGTLVGEQQLVVGYIKPNTTRGEAEGVTGSITIKAYLDKNKIAISDTYDGTESNEMGTSSAWVDGRLVITTNEWNNLQTNGMSFQIKVEAQEGIWVGEPFYNVMKSSTVMDNINSTYVQNATPGIDFNAISSDTNGKGIYTLSSTANDAYPIMYYRGDVDNNVLFGGFCWKVVRTTDTGGIKLIYNGNPVNNQCGNDRIIEKNQVVNFTINDFDDYTYTFGDSYSYDSTNKIFTLNGSTTHSAITSETVNSLIGKYFCNSFQTSSTCSSLVKVHSYDSSDGTISFTQVTQDSSIMLNDDNPNKDNVLYNLEVSSPASVGYMYGTNYVIGDGKPQAGNNSYMGNSFIYENGAYRLVDTVKWSVNSAVLSTHHYTCGLSDPNGTCESIRYYINAYRGNVNYINYITLTEGKSIEDALNEMFENENDSLAKTMIDTWYSSNMTNYTDKLEDTIYCNSRYISFLGGFNPNGGATDSPGYMLYFNMNGIKCSQKRDAFTVSSAKGNGKLTYPVAMLNYEEGKLAGAIYGLANPNTSFYLYDGNGYWTMTPQQFSLISYMERIYSGGNNGGTRVDMSSYMSGFRPVISLKEGTSVVSGNGTPLNPYVVE